MKTVSINGDCLDLSQSMLNELEGVCLEGFVTVDGAVTLNNNEKILPLISSFLNKRLDDKKISYETAKTYGRNLSYCLDYLMSREEFNGFALDDAFLTVTKPFLKDYFKSIEETLERKTLLNRDATLMAFFQSFLCLAADDTYPLREHDPYKDGMLTKGGKGKLIEACDINELEALMHCTDSERERVILQFIFDSGMRRSEISRVTSSDIRDATQFQRAYMYGTDRDSRVCASSYFSIKVKGSKGRHQEYKPRVSTLSAATFERIKSYHASPLYKKYARKYREPHSAPAFFNSTGGVLGAKSIDKLLDKLSKRAIKRRTLAKPISPHKLRHGYAYLVLQSPDFGESYQDRLVHVQKTLGHSQIYTTQLYSRIPHELNHLISGDNSGTLTRAQKMAVLTERTKLRIKIGDKK